MTTLNDIMMKPGTRDHVIDDCETLIDQEVNDKGGLTGLAIKGGYKFVKALKKGFIRDALDGLIDEFIEKLDPFYQEHGRNAGFDEFMVRNKGRVSDGMLKVTDERRDRSNNSALRKAYDKLRPMAKSNVEQAIPRLSRLVQKYLDQGS